MNADNGDRTFRVDPGNVLNARLNEFYRSLDWPADRAHVETRYEKLSQDTNSLQSLGIADLVGWHEPAIATLSYDWPLDSFVHYLTTWSGYRRLLDKDSAHASLLHDFTAYAKNELDEGANLCIDFDVFAVFYKKCK